jgi:hypothetical protein
MVPRPQVVAQDRAPLAQARHVVINPYLEEQRAAARVAARAQRLKRLYNESLAEHLLEVAQKARWTTFEFRCLWVAFWHLSRPGALGHNDGSIIAARRAMALHARRVQPTLLGSAPGEWVTGLYLLEEVQK